MPSWLNAGLIDRHPAPHEANLFDINAKYGDVVDRAEAIDYLERRGQG
jgi:maleamate amidohydrolase